MLSDNIGNRVASGRLVLMVNSHDSGLHSSMHIAPPEAMISNIIPRTHVPSAIGLASS